MRRAINPSITQYKQHVISRLTTPLIFSNLSPGSSEFESSTQTYEASKLIHNKQLPNLSFLCKGSEDRQEYIINTLVFENKTSQEKMIEFLNNISSLQISSIKKFHEFYEEETPGNRYKVFLIDKFLNTLSIGELIKANELYPDLKQAIHTTSFKYNVILAAWETIKELRNSGLRNMGFNTMNICLVENLTEKALVDKNERFKNIFSPIDIKIEYMFNHFRKLMLADAKRDLTLHEMVGFKFFSEKLCGKFRKVTDALKDHFSFILLILEVFLFENHLNFIEKIDFEERRIEESLLSEIGDLLIKKLIKECFFDVDFKEKNQRFFTEDNRIMQSLSDFKHVKIVNKEVNSLPWDLFTKGVKVIPEDRSLRFMLTIEVEDFPQDHLKFIAKHHVSPQLIQSAMNVLMDYETDHENQLIIVKCLNYFLQLFLDDLKNDVSRLDDRVLKKYLGLCFHIHHQNYDLIM